MYFLLFMLLSFCQQAVNVKTSQDVDDLIMGMASQIAEEVDHIVVEDLRGNAPWKLHIIRAQIK